ncbi:MAG TPA: nuclear transport factor 2 family protein [Mycobacteriales bacterium]|nr:nuclear transport factor 2 family protein [Mycobacteriales bacterium]
MSDAHEAIRNLLGRYCELMDEGDFDGLAALFDQGRLCDEFGSVFSTGSEQMAKMWRGQTMVYDGSPRTKHVTVNSIIHVDEEAGTATARSSYVVFQGLAGHAASLLPLQPIITGRYWDSFGRAADGSWHFTERRYLIDHQGNLSHHLSRTL